MRGEDQRRLLRGVRVRPAGPRSSGPAPTCPARSPASSTRSAATSRSSAERYAAALFGHLDADGVTVSPYLGEDAIEPFLATGDRLVYVLARTSNPSAGRFQSLVADGEPIHLHVARWAAERWTDGRVGLVVGATAPDELARLREAVPGPAFLVPGVGAQGGDAGAAARAADGTWSPGLVNVSRAIALASRGTDWQAAAAAAASVAFVAPGGGGATLEGQPRSNGKDRRYLKRCRFPDLGSSSCCW